MPDRSLMAAVRSEHHARLTALRDKPLSELEQLLPVDSEITLIRGRRVRFTVWKFRQTDNSLMIVIAAESGFWVGRRISIMTSADHIGFVVSPSGDRRDATDHDISEWVVSR